MVTFHDDFDGGGAWSGGLYMGLFFIRNARRDTGIGFIHIRSEYPRALRFNYARHRTNDLFLPNDFFLLAPFEKPKARRRDYRGFLLRIGAAFQVLERFAISHLSDVAVIAGKHLDAQESPVLLHIWVAGLTSSFRWIRYELRALFRRNLLPKGLRPERPSDFSFGKAFDDRLVVLFSGGVWTENADCGDGSVPDGRRFVDEANPVCAVV